MSNGDNNAFIVIGILVFLIICLIVLGILYSPKKISTSPLETIDEPTGIKEEPKRDVLISNDDSIKKIIKVG